MSINEGDSDVRSRTETVATTSNSHPGPAAGPLKASHRGRRHCRRQGLPPEPARLADDPRPRLLLDAFLLLLLLLLLLQWLGKASAAFYSAPLFPCIMTKMIKSRLLKKNDVDIHRMMSMPINRMQYISSLPQTLK